MADEVMIASFHRRFFVWTAATVLVGVAPWLVALLMNPVRYFGCGNPFAALGALVGGMLILPAFLVPACLLPAIVGYLVAVVRVQGESPEKVIPPAAVSAYARLSLTLIITAASMTLVFYIHESASPTGGAFVMVAGLAGNFLALVFFVWSWVVGLRLARVGLAARHAPAVCVDCGFAIHHDLQLGCPNCGGGAYPTDRDAYLPTSEWIQRD